LPFPIVLPHSRLGRGARRKGWRLGSAKFEEPVVRRRTGTRKVLESVNDGHVFMQIFGDGCTRRR
jgi:hypothetical protein